MRTFLSLSIALLAAGTLRAQMSGNQAYQRGGSSYETRAGNHINYLTDSTFLIGANVLMNVVADQYVAVFAASAEGATIEACNTKIDATIDGFVRDLKKLGIGDRDYYVDIITQNRIYDYDVKGNTATEVSPGFELKKNISIRFRERDQIRNIMLAAAAHDIFDLVKVDYVVDNLSAVHDKLMERAGEVIARKRKRFEAVTGSTTSQKGEIYAEEFNSRYPEDAYQRYTAYEASSISGYSNNSLVVKNARKSQTFYFDPLNLSGFDEVINPVVLEPVVQFSLWLAIRYDLQR